MKKKEYLKEYWLTYLGVLILLIILVAPIISFKWDIGFEFGIFSIVLWMFLIIFVITALIVPKKYRDKVLEFIEDAFEKIMEALH